MWKRGQNPKYDKGLARFAQGQALEKVGGPQRPEAAGCGGLASAASASCS